MCIYRKSDISRLWESREVKTGSWRCFWPYSYLFVTENATNGIEVQVEDLSYEPATVDENDTVGTKSVEPGEQTTLSEPQVRKPIGENHSSTRYLESDYVLITNEGETGSFQKVKTHTDKQSWVKMEEEINSLQMNNTYELAELSTSKKALKNACVFKLKKYGENKWSINLDYGEGFWSKERDWL